MVMRRAGKASPDAIKAERTRSRASENRLVRKTDYGEGRHIGRDLDLDIDRLNLVALESHGGNALDHVPPLATPTS
jgi:hypothetical protein